MTSNHLLLFHLAELMLKHEQHILPVDILFNDNQIGDFVKSIQIDSPYQQLLLEGVITESVLNEKLYVSFTVEGYFHYVLGEVIEKKLVGKNSIQFSDLLKSNQLTGLLEGIENALIREVENGQTQLLYELIDSGGDILNACITPLAHLFLINIGYDYSKPDFEVIKKHIASIVNILFSKFSDHDIAILQLTIVKLEEIQKYELVSIIYEFIFNSIKPSTINQAILLTKAIPYIDAQQRVSKLKFLSELNIKKKSFDYFLFLFELASCASHFACHKTNSDSLQMCCAACI
jgi:hypothetical protein